jgi:hypothetical protein
MRCGRADDWLNSGVPHRGQKRRRMVLPLSARLTNSPIAPSLFVPTLIVPTLIVPTLIVPVLVSPAALKTAFTEALPDERYWQSLHQHTRVASGRWSNWKRTAPQKQPPVTDPIILLRSPKMAA